MQSNKWGAHAWEFFHTITFNYPLKPSYEIKEQNRHFFENIRHILPCNICKESFTFFYEHIPIDYFLDDRNGVVYWLYVMHNIINLKLGYNTVNLKYVILKYENNRAKCGNIDTTNLEKIKECQDKKKWNEEMENFYINTINKYQNYMVKKISNIIKKYKNRQEIVNIKYTLKKLCKKNITLDL